MYMYIYIHIHIHIYIYTPVELGLTLLLQRDRSPSSEAGGGALNENVSNVIMLVSSLALAVGERLSVRCEVSVGSCSRT